MKKRIVLAAVAFYTAAFTIAQNVENVPLGKDTVNFIDARGKKQGKWVYLGAHKDSSCYGRGQKVEEGLFIDGKRSGEWINYYCNGNKKSILNYSKGIPGGKLVLFNSEGIVIEEGTRLNNKWVGEYKFYYPNGKLQYQFVFNQKGLRDGVQKYFYENGNVASEVEFNDGFEDGTYKEYDATGKFKTGKIYKKGKLISEYVSGNETRPLSFSGFGY